MAAGQAQPPGAEDDVSSRELKPSLANLNIKIVENTLCKGLIVTDCGGGAG